jgi:L-ornithine N5-oxygenase
MMATYDIVGVGYGPANLALAAAHSECAAARGLSCIFVDEKPDFSWHPSMMVDGASMQIPFLMDLATSRDPKSRFTFINYLWEMHRLDHFIALENLLPSRQEFADYLAWAARNLAGYCSHGVSAREITLAPGNGNQAHYDVLCQQNSGAQFVLAARSLVLGVGARPHVIESAKLSRTAFHTETLLESLKAFPYADAPYRFIVVGAGQSGAEAFYHLFRQYRNAEIAVISNGLIFSDATDNPFIRLYEHQRGRDLVVSLPESGRKPVVEALKGFNLSVVDDRLSNAIAADLYEERVVGTQRSRFLSFHEFLGHTETAEGQEVTARCRSTGQVTSMSADALVFATGYKFDNVRHLLKEIEPHLVVNERGYYSRDKSLRLSAASRIPPIFVHTTGDPLEGVSEGLISHLGDSATRILDGVRDAFTQDRLDALLQI